MRVQFVIAVESLTAKSTFRMALEARLIYGARIVIAKFLMFPQLVLREKLVLVSEDLFVASA
jgi:hypothetical protein